MKKYFLLTFIFSFLIILPNVVKATTNVELISNATSLKKGDTFSVNINLNGDAISSCDLNIYFDSDKIEYVSGPNNSNFVNGRILFVWYSEDGMPRTDFTLGSFEFRVKENADIKLAMYGNCYNENGVVLDTNFKDFDLSLETSLANDNIAISSEVSPDNSYLKSLRTNREEIEPDFNKDVFEYFLATDDDIKNLEISAIPENAKSQVQIFGNDNFVFGQNKVEIKVTSEDKRKTSSYIIYVTKTSDLNKSNTNLETLAVENALLSPSFEPNITNYRIDVANDVEILNILAIPQNTNASVKIDKKDVLDVGDNYITIVVTSEDKLSFKNYRIVAHRRTTEEQTEYETNLANENKQLENLLNNTIDNVSESSLDATTLDNSSDNISSDEQIAENSKNKLIFLVISSIVLVLIVVGGIWWFIRHKKGK